MDSLLTPSNIMFAIGIMGVIFSVFQYFNKPQQEGATKDALLAQQVQWAQEANDRRFAEVNENFKALLLQSNNHIHTVDVKVDKVAMHMGDVEKSLVKLHTILEERIPKKVKDA